MKNKKILITASLLTIIIAIFFFTMLKQAQSYKASVKVYLAKTDIKVGTKFKKSDYIVKDIDLSDLNSNDLRINDSILKKKQIIKEPIYKGERVNKRRLIESTSPQAISLKLQDNQVEFSINTQLLDNYAGTFREGDKVTLFFTPRSTNTNPNPSTVILIPEIKVLGAIDDQGKFLTDNNQGSLATGLSFAGTKDQMLKVANTQDKGTFKIGRLNPSVQ